MAHTVNVPVAQLAARPVRPPAPDRGAAPIGPQLRAAAPALALVALWLVWVAASGGYWPETWYPSALATLAGGAAIAIWRRALVPRPGPARTALGLLWALVALQYASILWAGSPGGALQAANELALYALVAWVLTLVELTPRALLVAAGCWSAGVCAICAVQLARAASAADLTAFFVDGRFAAPMSYSNATGAIAAMALWPALMVWRLREARAWARVAGLGVAALLGEFALLPSSRAAVLGMAVVAVVVLAISRDRARLLAGMLVVAGAIAATASRSVAVDNAASAGADATPVLRHAAIAIALGCAAALAAGALLVGAEAAIARAWAGRHRDGIGRLRATAARAARSRGPRAVGAAALLAALGVALALAEPRLVALVHTIVRQGTSDASTGTNRLLSTSPEERFDYWRVALRLFASSPLVGIGAGSFGRRYDAMRRFLKHSQYVHDLPLRVLAETGAVGELLFLSLLAVLAFALVRAARRRDSQVAAGALIALAVSSYFLVHSLVDWVDEFPALAAPAIGLPLAALSLAHPAAPPVAHPAAPAVAHPAAPPARRAATRAPERGRWGWPGPAMRRRAGAATAAVAGLALLVALGGSYLSVSLVDRAFAIFRLAPGQAYRDLRLAGELDPLSADPYTSEGTIALYLGDLRRSRAAFERSLAIEDDWYPRLELALIDSRQGERAAALAQIAAAARLDVRDPVIALARQQIRAGLRIDPVAFDRLVLAEGAATSPGRQPVR